MEIEGVRATRPRPPAICQLILYSLTNQFHNYPTTLHLFIQAFDYEDLADVGLVYAGAGSLGGWCREA
jgi:hypothetical protein